MAEAEVEIYWWLLVNERKEMDVIFSLLLLSSSLLLLNVAGDPPCSEGFMDYSVLKFKAGHIGITHSIPGGIAKGNASKWIIQDDSNKFDCSNTMTLKEVFIGVDIRTETSTRNKYPSIEIWSKKGKSYEETDKSFTIKLSPDNFTTNGLYRYTLSPALSMNRNDRLVLYQPPNADSVVRFYTVTSNSNKDKIGRFHNTDDSSIRVRRMGKMDATVTWNTFTKVLLQPILGMLLNLEHIYTLLLIIRLNLFSISSILIIIISFIDNTDCYSSIDTSFNANRLLVTNLKLVNDTRVFPSIKFTCHGIITNWIIGATPNTHPLIMIRHSDNTTTNALSIGTASISLIHVYNITVNNDVRVQPGDVLMINSTGTNMYYQQHNGPFNYRLGINSALTTIDSNDYPLISPIISK